MGLAVLHGLAASWTPHYGGGKLRERGEKRARNFDRLFDDCLWRLSVAPIARNRKLLFLLM